MGSLADLQAAFHSFQARKGAELQEIHTAKEAVEQEAATLRSQLQAAQDQLEQHRSRSGMAVPVQPAVPAPQGPRRHMADMEADLVVQRSLASMGSHGGRLACVAASGEALPLQPLPSAGRENLGGLVATSLSPVKLEEPGTEQGGWPPGYLFKYSVRVGWVWGWAAGWEGWVRMYGQRGWAAAAARMSQLLLDASLQPRLSCTPLRPSQDAAPPLSPGSSRKARGAGAARSGFLGQSRLLLSHDENGARGLLGSQRFRLPSVSMYARLQEGPGGN